MRSAAPLLALVALPALAVATTPAARAPAPRTAARAVTRTAVVQQEPVEAISLLGDSLRRPTLAPAARARMEAQLDTARRAHAATPGGAESLVWVARRLGYLGRFREAIDVLSRGAAAHPDDAWIHRHRGHRYLTVRDFPRAAADLARAARLTRGRPDLVEPDGVPNERNQPIGTLQSNTYYHLALAHYYQGDWARALDATTEGMRLASNPDRLVSQLHWHYLALRRLGRHDEARRALAPVRRDLDVFENGNYHRLTLFYKGELPADSVLAPDAPIASSGDAAMAYGLGAWLLVEGRRDEARATFRRIVASRQQWPSFGYVAAEAELARMR